MANQRLRLSFHFEIEMTDPQRAYLFNLDDAHETAGSLLEPGQADGWSEEQNLYIQALHGLFSDALFETQIPAGYRMVGARLARATEHWDA